MRIIATVALLLALAAVTVGIVLAISDTQTASCGVNAASASVDLYICEASDTVPGPPCASDDSGGDEIIFEGLKSRIAELFPHIREITIHARQRRIIKQPRKEGIKHCPIRSA